MIGFPKATYMYWQKRFDRENPKQELEDKILEIHENNKDYGYRRMWGELRNQGFAVNKQKNISFRSRLGIPNESVLTSA